jgi:type IV secretion system protein VirB9
MQFSPFSKTVCCLQALAFFLLASFAAEASQLPRFLGTEKKFRSYIYNPNDVYRYIGHYTYQGFIEFADGESISTISMGNPSLWLFEHLGNRLFLKPVGEDRSETNMTVITNKKVYHFELMAKEAKNINDKDLVFVAKFVYPDEKDKNIVSFPKIPPSDEPDMRDLSQYNFNYQYTGEPGIAPIKVFDNGEFTFFQFPKKNAEIPAIFSVDAEGFESLVNFRATGNYIIVERVGPQFTLRSGSDIVCVYNTNLYTTGRFKQSTVKNPYKNTGNFAGFTTDASPSAGSGYAPPMAGGDGYPQGGGGMSMPSSPSGSIPGGGYPGMPGGGDMSQDPNFMMPPQGASGAPDYNSMPTGVSPQASPMSPSMRSEDAAGTFPESSSQKMSPPMMSGPFERMMQ